MRQENETRLIFTKANPNSAGTIEKAPSYAITQPSEKWGEFGFWPERTLRLIKLGEIFGESPIDISIDLECKCAPKCFQSMTARVSQIVATFKDLFPQLTQATIPY